jgi:phosphatidylserine/phosphatidylglycerophosphate/cardiolipin synthase-like enzyme
VSSPLRAIIGLLLGVSLAPLGATSVAGAQVPPSCRNPPGSQYSLSVLPSPLGYSQVYAATQRARYSLDLVMYELSDPTEIAALVAARERGVNVRVVLDRDYSGGRVNGPAAAYLSSHGVNVTWGPVNVIVHQKTLIVDGSCALIMTGNLTPQYYETSRDLIVTDTNPADVAGAERLFTHDFRRLPIAGGYGGGGVPGTSLVASPGSETPLVDLIDGAQRSITVESEEMTEPYILDALTAAARRGVACRVIMTNGNIPDDDASRLRSAGCRVVEWPATARGLYIHAKFVAVDLRTPRARAFIGSENMSVASLAYDRELGVVVNSRTGPAVLALLSKTIAYDARG